jgi:hypothetical protein
MSEKTLSSIKKKAVNNATILNKDYKGSEDMVMATIDGKKPKMVKLADIKILFNDEYKSLDFILKSLYGEISSLKNDVEHVRDEYDKTIKELKGGVVL